MVGRRQALTKKQHAETIFKLVIPHEKTKFAINAMHEA